MKHRYEIHIWNDDEDFYDHAPDSEQAMGIASEFIAQGYAVTVRHIASGKIVFRSE